MHALVLFFKVGPDKALVLATQHIPNQVSQDVGYVDITALEEASGDTGAVRAVSVGAHLRTIGGEFILLEKGLIAGGLTTRQCLADVSEHPHVAIKAIKTLFTDDNVAVGNDACQALYYSARGDEEKMKARGITINETSATGSSAAKAEWWHKAGAAIYNNGGAYFMVVLWCLLIGLWRLWTLSPITHDLRYVYLRMVFGHLLRSTVGVFAAAVSHWEASGPVLGWSIPVSVTMWFTTFIMGFAYWEKDGLPDGESSVAFDVWVQPYLLDALRTSNTLTT